MIVIKNEDIVAFDVDDTLILWFSNCDPSEKIDIISPGSGIKKMALKPHKRHIDLLKEYKGRGMTVIVWSAGGYGWAQAVVEALGLEEFVDYVMTKPCKLIDDLPPELIFTNRIYLEDK